MTTVIEPALAQVGVKFTKAIAKFISSHFTQVKIPYTR